MTSGMLLKFSEPHFLICKIELIVPTLQNCYDLNELCKEGAWKDAWDLIMVTFKIGCSFECIPRKHTCKYYRHHKLQMAKVSLIILFSKPTSSLVFLLLTLTLQFTHFSQARILGIILKNSSFPCTLSNQSLRIVD